MLPYTVIDLYQVDVQAVISYSIYISGQLPASAADKRIFAAPIFSFEKV